QTSVTGNKTLAGCNHSSEEFDSSYEMVEQTDDHREGFLARCLSAGFHKLIVLTYAHPLQYAVLLEFRSLILRIQTLRRTKLYKPNSLRSARLISHANEYPFSCECQAACSRDITEVYANHPWATALDKALFLEGWDKGARTHHCGGGNPCCCMKRMPLGTAGHCD